MIITTENNQARKVVGRSDRIGSNFREPSKFPFRKREHLEKF
jgi:hypothetical protein